MSSATPINVPLIGFQLREAVDAIESTLKKLKSDPENPLYIELAHIVGHLCLSWHYRNLQVDEVLGQSQDDYEMKLESVPNWGAHFRLVDMYACRAGFELQSSRPRFDVSTPSHFLLEAKAAIEKIIYRIEKNETNYVDLDLSASDFERVLRLLILSWHLRYLREKEVSELDPKILNELSSNLPQWSPTLKLV